MDQLGLTAAGVIKLEGQRNWNLWKFQITVLFKAQGVYEVVNGSELKSEKDPGGWSKKDVKAQSILVTRLSESAMTHIITCETAAEMWCKLLSVYEQKSSTSIHLLQQRFFSFKYEEGTEISTFLSKVQEMKCQLKQAGEDISEKFVITKVLMSLPSSFSHFVSASESVDLEKQKYDDLVARLLVEEERMKSKSAEEDKGIALLTRNASSAGGSYGVGVPVRKCFKCGRTGHFMQECRSTEETRRCFDCNEVGHLKHQCPKRKSNQCNHNHCKKCDDNQRSYVFSTMTFDNVMVTCADNRLSRRWIIDSGASEHMTFQRKHFTSFTEVSNRCVVVGDGRSLPVLGFGEIRFKHYKLCKALFVPELKVNLFSVQSVTSKGYTVHLSPGGYSIKREGETCIAGYKENNFYVFDFEKCECEAAENIDLKRRDGVVKKDRVGGEEELIFLDLTDQKDVTVPGEKNCGEPNVTSKNVQQDVPLPSKDDPCSTDMSNLEEEQYVTRSGRVVRRPHWLDSCDTSFMCVKEPSTSRVGGWRTSKKMRVLNKSESKICAIEGVSSPVNKVIMDRKYVDSEDELGRLKRSKKKREIVKLGFDS